MKNNNFKIYMFKFPNNKIYIGLSGREDIESRWQSGRGYQRQPYVYNAIQKYGWENIERTIIADNLEKNEAEIKEVELIKKYSATNKDCGYNLSNGGNGCRYKWTEEQKESLKETLSLWKYNKNAVICLETLKIYASPYDATNYTGFKNIEKCCEKKSEYAFKKLKTKTKITHWIYYSEYRILNNISI